MNERVCPIWVGYLLASPIRRLFQNPDKILGPYVKEGMHVLDIGCAMGFFSLPAAAMVGKSGRVLCIDVQEKMTQALQKRADRAGLSDRIETRVCQSDSLCISDLAGTIDFALAMAVVHEVPEAAIFFKEICKALKPSGQLLVAEPKAHVSEKAFEQSLSSAARNGFRTVSAPTFRQSRAALLAPA